MDGAKKIVLEDDYATIFVGYVPVREDLSDDADVPAVPKSLHKNIADYALVEYFRAQRDNGEAMNALSIAQAYLNEQLAAL